MPQIVTHTNFQKQDISGTWSEHKQCQQLRPQKLHKSMHIPAQNPTLLQDYAKKKYKMLQDYVNQQY